MVHIIATIYKQMILQPEVQWSNVYSLNSANTVAALDNAEEIAGFEAAVMSETARVFRLHCVENVPGSDGAIRNVDIEGTQPVAEPTELLPMWNTVKVSFENVIGRPEIKYLKLPLYKDMIDGLEIAGSVYTQVVLGYAAPLAAYEFYVGPGLEVHTGYQVSRNIQMRQTDWHRRQRPGYKRGWVPV